MNEQIKQEIDRIILDVKTRGWKFNRVTKKALRRIDELGLRDYIPEWMTRDGAKSDAIINEIIKQAENAGGQTITERAAFDDAYTYTTEPSTLYTLLNAPEETETSDDAPEELTDSDRQRFTRIARRTSLGRHHNKNPYGNDDEMQEFTAKMVNAGLIRVLNTRPADGTTMNKHGLVWLEATEQGLRLYAKQIGFRYYDGS